MAQGVHVLSNQFGDIVTANGTSLAHGRYGCFAGIPRKQIKKSEHY
jgi:hypothetical protein